MFFPTSPDTLTASWLTEVLRAGGALPEGRVTSFECEVLGGTRGAMSILGRLSLTYAGGDGPRP